MRKVLLVKAHVSGYTKKDGTYVATHEDVRNAADPAGYHQHAQEMLKKYGTGWYNKASQEDKAEYERRGLAHNEAINAPKKATKQEKKTSGEVVHLYHGSHEENIKEVKDDGAFRGLFASSSKESASGPGGRSHVHVIEVHSDKIATRRDMRDLSGKQLATANKVIREEIGTNKLSNKDLQLVRDAVLDEKDVFELDDDSADRLTGLLGSEDYGEASWELQKIRGLVARSLGYHAVEMTDEHGVSHLVLPGAKVRPDTDDDVMAKSVRRVVLVSRTRA